MGYAEDNNNFYMELEFCARGNLSTLMLKNKESNYLEKEIKRESTQLLLGLKTLHQNGIIHCNLQPSNILIDEFGNVKICDFKKIVKINEMSYIKIQKNKMSMSPYYSAPELFSLTGLFSFKSDLWALGCIMYEMAVGQVPFYDKHINELVYNIINYEVDFEKIELEKYSIEFIDVLKKLLVKNPDDRISWEEIENFAFWEFEYSSNNFNNISLNDSFLNFSFENSNIIKNNNFIQNEEDDDYASSKNNNNTKNTEQEFNFQNDCNLKNEKQEEDISNKDNKINTIPSNSINIKVRKINIKKDNRGIDVIQNEILIVKPDELSQIHKRMIHNSDISIKQIIGNIIIDSPENIIIDYESCFLKLKEIKKLFFDEKYEQIENYLIEIYQLMDKYALNNQNKELLNILNYFESIIKNKELANSIVNSLFMELLIKFLDIKDNNIRIRSCSIIGYIIRYSKLIEIPLDKYNLTKKLILLISEKNINLNKIGITTLGEHLFFLAAKITEEYDLNSEWNISQEALSTLLFALTHSGEKVRFYSLKTIENIFCINTICKNYFTSNNNYISQILNIYNEKCDNNEIYTCALKTCSHLIRHKPSLLKVFIDKVNTLNLVLKKENQNNQQYIINCLLFGIAGDDNNIKIINLDDFIPECINLLESGNSIIKGKIILLFSLIFNDADIIIKYGEKVFELMQKLRKDRKFYSHVKIYEIFLIKFCDNIIKYFISIENNKKNDPEIISLIDCLKIISPYQKVSIHLYKIQFFDSLINILNNNINNENEILITKSFDLIKSLRENQSRLKKKIDFIIKQMFQKIFSLTLKLNKNYKRFPLNIYANILIIILDDEDLYSATEINKGKTGQINNIILDILPTIYDLLKNSDTLRDSLSFLSLIIERNSAFIK